MCVCVHVVNVRDLPCGVIAGMKLTELMRALPAWRRRKRRSVLARTNVALVVRTRGRERERLEPAARVVYVSKRDLL